MIENLEKWMHINDVESTALVDAGKELESDKNLKPIIFTQKGAILYYFAKLLNEEIGLEEFFYIGDSTGKYNTIVEQMYSANMDAAAYIKTKLELNPDYANGKIFILDKTLKLLKIEGIKIFYI